MVYHKRRSFGAVENPVNWIWKEANPMPAKMHIRFLVRHPAESCFIGHDDKMQVDPEAATTPFAGKLINLKVE